jgi:hypothetical protein
LVGKEKHWLQCVKQPASSSIDIDNNSEVIVDGKEFVSLLGKVGIACGKSTGDPSWSQVLLRTNGSKLDLATFNGLQLGWAQFEVTKSSGSNIQTRVSYEILMAVANMLDTDVPVRLYMPNGDPKGLIIQQDIVYGGSVIGTACYRLFATTEKFPNFEKVIRDLSFRSTCKVSVQNLKYIVGRLDVVETIRTKISFDVNEKTIAFSKESASVRSEDVVLPLLESSGDNIAMQISSRILKAAVDKCEEEVVEIKFTGAQGMVLVNVSPKFKMFFQPFAEE